MADRELSAAPSMLPLFARAGLAMVPGASRLPWVGGGGGEIPPDALTLSDVETDRDRLAAYDRVCGFRLGRCPAAHLPAHAGVWAATGADDQRAVSVPGHRARPHRQRDHPAPPDRCSRATLAEGVGRTGRAPSSRAPVRHPHRGAGRRRARVGGGLDEPAARRRARRRARRAGAEIPSSEALPVAATWKLRGDLGRRYGAVSGDLNPIHVHPLSARLFGFPSAIAHGMWTKARCLAALDSELPGAFTVQVAFKRPIVLPATVGFAEARTAGGIDFGVRDAKRDTPHLDGRVSFAMSGRPRRPRLDVAKRPRRSRRTFRAAARAPLRRCAARRR